MSFSSLAMSFDPRYPVEVFVCFCPVPNTSTLHWMLMLRSKDCPIATWYHAVGGPTHAQPYRVAIDSDKRFDSQGFASTKRLGVITARDVNRVRTAAQRVPAQHCQMYVTALVAELEDRNLLVVRTSVQLFRQVRMDRLAREYRQRHPVAQLHSWERAGLDALPSPSVASRRGSRSARSSRRTKRVSRRPSASVADKTACCVVM